MKNWTGKLVGGLLGFAIYPPWGLVIGLLLGHFYDRFLAMGSFNRPVLKAQQVFFDSTFLLMGHLAKADGRVSENEIQAAKRVMAFMGLTEDRKKAAIALFNQGKKADFDYQAQLNLLKKHCGHRPSLLRIFLDIQVQMAQADGHFSPQTRALLEKMGRTLNLSLHFERPFHEYTHSHKTHSGFTTADSAYQTLGISNTASAQEIKKAYRKLMSENHPDKLIAKGLPEDMIKIATEKTQKIKQAYERLCEIKGLP